MSTRADNPLPKKCVTRRCREEIPAHVVALATLLAKQYANGWKAHCDHVGELQGMPAHVWASRNWSAFVGVATKFYRVNHE